MKAIIILLLLTAVGVLSLTVYSQTPAPKADNLALTPAELKAGQDADAALKGAVEALNAALLGSDSVKTDAEAAALGWKIGLLFGRVRTAQGAFTDWFEGVRAAHGCKDCTLGEGGKLVRPAAKEEKK